MAYTKTNWVNGSAPAINANNLNKIETELEALDNDVSTAKGNMEVISTKKTLVAEELLETSISSSTTNALTKNIVGFDFVEIFYLFNDNEGNYLNSSVKMKVVEGMSGTQRTVLPIGWWYSANPVQQGFQFQGITISGKDISYGYRNRMLVSPTAVSYTTTNIDVMITSVLGLKYEDILPSNS